MSTIKLYTSQKQGVSTTSWKLIASKLFKIDNIASYLAQFTPVTITKFKYTKQGLEISIKIDASQANAQPNSDLGYKYVSIQNDNENIAYYYVKKTTWRSENTIQLDLVMDVLNSLNEGSDYVFKANTRITREHKPRYIAQSFSITIFNYSPEGSYGTINLYDEVYFGYIDGEGDEQWLCKGVITRYDSDIHLELNISSLSSIKEIVKREVEASRDFIISPNADFENYLEFSFTEYVFDGSLYRKIDYVQENINPLLICKDYKGKNIEDVGDLNQNWYLLYRNTNNPDPDDLTNPVECYLIPEKAVNVTSGSIIASKVYPENLKEGYWYYCKCYINGVRNIQLTFSNGYTSHNSGTQDHIVMMRRIGDRIEAREYSVALGAVFQYPLQTGLLFITLGSLPCPYIISPYQLNNAELSSSNTFLNEQYWNTAGTPAVTGNVNNIDRTDPKNIKLIKLPYCPYTFAYDENNNYINLEGSQWTYVSLHQADTTEIACLKLDDLNTKLMNSLIGPEEVLAPLAYGISLGTIGIGDLRSRIDSKLFNSEFYQPKLCYDSFVYTFELEKLTLSHYISADNRKLVLDFVMTRTINSKFLFRVVDYTSDKAESNYPDVLCIGRNNEEVLYNSSYVNYIRTGFNYDVKAKNISNASQWIGVGASGLATVASLALPSIPLKIAGIVGSLVSMAMSVKSAVVNTINNEQSLKQKILQEQNRTASVVGSDDVDLMSEYTGNRLKYIVYEPNDIMKAMLNDLFYYAGYSSNRMGIPNHNTRVNFDYLECEAELVSAGANVPQEILDELKNCFKVGVTYIHQTDRLGENKWDIDQVFENWEKELLQEE